VLAVVAGAGGADALVLETGAGTVATEGLTVTEAINNKEYVTYAKHREYRERVDYKGVSVP